MSKLIIIHSGEGARHLPYWVTQESAQEKDKTQQEEVHLLVLLPESQDNAALNTIKKTKAGRLHKQAAALWPPDQTIHTLESSFNPTLTELLDYIEKENIFEVWIEAEKTGSSSSGYSLSTSLAQKATCSVLSLQAGTQAPDSIDRILIPCSESKPKRAVLKRAADLAHSTNAELVPIFVRSDTGEESSEVGLLRIKNLLKKAGVDTKPGHIRPRIVINQTLDDALSHVAEEGKNDLILIEEAAESSQPTTQSNKSLRRILESESGVLTYRVASRPDKQLGSKWKRRFTSWVPQLERTNRVELVESLESRSRWSVDFIVLMCLSTIIASLGLLQNSSPVVIGAMLVAPLMTPLLGAGLSLIQGNLPLLKDCFQAILYGFITAILIGILTGALGTPLSPSSESGQLSSEILSRGGPSLLDLGVAFFSGIAASYCLARPGLASALAGVAIAAALVPPIASCGIALSQGAWPVAQGAGLLFGTNVVAIILASALTFRLLGIKGPVTMNRATLWSRLLFFVLVVICLLLVLPLSKYGRDLFPTLLSQ